MVATPWRVRYARDMNSELDRSLTLRDLNEVIDNFDQVIARSFEGLEKRINERFTKVDEQFIRVDHRFNELEYRINDVEHKFEQRFIGIDKRFDALDRRLDHIEERDDFDAESQW